MQSGALASGRTAIYIYDGANSCATGGLIEGLVNLSALCLVLPVRLTASSIHRTHGSVQFLRAMHTSQDCKTLWSGQETPQIRPNLSLPSSALENLCYACFREWLTIASIADQCTNEECADVTRNIRIASPTAYCNARWPDHSRWSGNEHQNAIAYLCKTAVPSLYKLPGDNTVI